MLIGLGLASGALSGFFGIGGGFLIVPALIFATGMPILNAVGTSLFAISVFGFATALNYARSGLVDWPLAGLLIAGGVAEAQSAPRRGVARGAKGRHEYCFCDDDHPRRAGHAGARTQPLNIRQRPRLRRAQARAAAFERSRRMTSIAASGDLRLRALAAILAVVDQFLDHAGVGERRGVAERTILVLGDLA